MLFQLQIQAQVGEKKIALMNSYIINNGASQMAPLGYNSQLGFIEQSNFGLTERYKIYEIKRIEVSGKDNTYAVQFFCDEKDPCVSQTKDNELGKYVSSVAYFFKTAVIANSFAKSAQEIITLDYKKEVVIKLIGGEDVASVSVDVPIKKVAPIKKEVEKEEPVKKQEVDHLSVSNYSKSNNNPAEATSPFVQKIQVVIKNSEKNKLEDLKGPAMDNAWASKLKMPKAKKNYINQFKGENCFVSEYGTSKFIDDLEDVYYELQDELDNNLSQDWEMIDHSQDDIYEDSEDDIYHVEYINQENKDNPSITLMIVPDGKRYTVFMRVGKY